MVRGCFCISVVSTSSAWLHRAWVARLLSRSSLLDCLPAWSIFTPGGTGLVRYRGAVHGCAGLEVWRIV